ncbi:hypothetical protein CY34DRAFT_802531 [Suillus luteus UH-Slu-Lm8-n1]|uniref:Telomeric single stranded DNA binding POT1/Cdc13 domain-containing protein n=1 Tax=Suillus luteus UH-Slu-Lm8-n1 TaxID=930992 RepID=A0A0D0A3J0_9AGAM|nr:hypothetical protein CY34DRAFT_802531 [Suillus luteus UH-Slu-Lm8-n1]
MKRFSVAEESSPKRPRLEDNLSLFDEARRKNATDLLDLETDETNNIEAKVHMIFPSVDRQHQVNVEMHEHGKVYRCLVLISSKVVELLPFPFIINERICISLKGAQIRPRAPSSAPCHLPVALVFKEGIAVMVMSGPSAGKVFSTFEVDWYSTTGDIPRVKDVVQQHCTEDVEMRNTNPPSKNPHPEIVTSQKAREEPMAVLAPQQRLSSSAANLPQSGVELPEKELTKQQKRRRKRQARKSAALEIRPKSGGHETTVPQAEAVAPRAPSSPPTAVRTLPQVPSSERTSSEQTSSPSPNRASPISSTHDRASNRGSLAMKTGMTTAEAVGCMPIRKVEMRKDPFSIIGVVTSSKPITQTRSKEWSRNFVIADPSCMEEGVVTYNLKVNCFQKKRIEWLPQAEFGDIVIFRDLKTSVWAGGFNAVGYGDTLRWVTYDTQTRRFRDPDRVDASDSEKLPYYEPNIQGKEAEYCAKLADWWQVLQGGQHGVTTVQCTPYPSREHHLISEVTEDTSPEGYFDCTVEILHIYENTDRPHTVYVTDYTINPDANPPQARWCSPELSPYVFKMEMWDSAKLLAKSMQPGEFWCLPNTRVRTDTYHHLHGKLVVTQKSKKLDEVANGENLHFRALLERKKTFEQGGASVSSARFDTKLIEAVDGEVGFFHCTVEALHVDLASAEGPVFYVTDYTFNHDLLNPREQVSWALGLDRRIVKIVLEDGQKERARDLQPGAMYRIRNLRLIKRAGVNGAFGRLGGDERLIIAVNDLMKNDVQALIQHKEKWKLTMHDTYLK